MYRKTPVPESFFLIEMQACNFFKKETLAQVLSYEFCKISNNTLFIEPLWATAFCYHHSISERQHALVLLEPIFPIFCTISTILLRTHSALPIMSIRYADIPHFGVYLNSDLIY